MVEVGGKVVGFAVRRRTGRPGVPMDTQALDQQLEFLREIDKLKRIDRQSPLLDRSRRENSAEHSWHLAMYAWLLAGWSSGPVDLGRVIRMLLLHDVVEIDAGDTPIHGGGSPAAQEADELRAAERIFGLLPAAQRDEMMALFREFEDAQTEDAKFAKALDRFQPLLVNVFTGGGTWSESRVAYAQVLERYGPTIRRGAPHLWAVAQRMVATHFGRD